MRHRTLQDADSAQVWLRPLQEDFGEEGGRLQGSFLQVHRLLLLCQLWQLRRHVDCGTRKRRTESGSDGSRRRTNRTGGSERAGTTDIS